MLIATVDDKRERERKEPVLQGKDFADNTQ